MFYKVINLYSLITFDKEKYKDIQKNIENSRGYVTFINNQKGKAQVNPRYQKYLNYKQAMYTFYRPRIPLKEKPNSKYVFASILPEDIDKKKLDSLYQKYGILDDYVNEYKVLSEDTGGSYSAIHTPKPIEYLAYENLIEMDNTIERINRTHLSENFIMHNHRRFTLLPFVVKDGANYTEGYVIANIYDVGLITLQVTITFSFGDTPDIPQNPPRKLVIPEVYLHKTKSNYGINDFWEKDIKKIFMLIR